MKKWEIVNRLKIKDLGFKIRDLIGILLENRGLTNKKDIEAFLHPDLSSVTPKSVGIDQKHLRKALNRIEKAIEQKEQIIVFGDYDVDGITGSAILWETLHSLGANCLPYIPDRKSEGYGLSIKGIEKILDPASKSKDVSLIITVDNGIVANEAVAFANNNKIDVIITDHHTVGAKLPDALAIVHTTNLCGAGVAYLLSKEINNVILGSEATPESKKRKDAGRTPLGTGASMTSLAGDSYLELAALGTVADLVPLIGANRTIVFEGLKKLHRTKRPGLHALFQQARIDQEAIGVYEIGYLIGPRLNASGRLESAMDSLRLVCTTNQERATELATKLELTNRERQHLLKEAAEHAIKGIRDKGFESKKLLVVGHESYEEGIIGLVAGKLVEAFYRPAIVLSFGENVSKASVRSIKGFNIIDFLRMHIDHFVNVGGHPMAAGFSIETVKIASLQKALEENAELLITEELLIRSLKIDCELPFSSLTKELYNEIQKLAPFGMGNPEPVFVTYGVTVESFRVIGKERNHLRLDLKDEGKTFQAIAFGMGELGQKLKTGDTIDIVYALDENTWNNETKLQLKVKDIKY